MQAYKLPIRKERGFPQTIMTRIKEASFAVTYSFNSETGFLTMKLYHVTSRRNAFIGKVCKRTPYVIRNPTTGLFWFVLFAVDVSQENLEVWVVY